MIKPITILRALNFFQQYVNRLVRTIKCAKRHHVHVSALGQAAVPVHMVCTR